MEVDIRTRDYRNVPVARRCGKRRLAHTSGAARNTFPPRGSVRGRLVGALRSLTSPGSRYSDGNGSNFCHTIAPDQVEVKIFVERHT
jgi:hypothetical protein